MNSAVQNSLLYILHLPFWLAGSADSTYYNKLICICKYILNVIVFIKHHKEFLTASS